MAGTDIRGMNPLLITSLISAAIAASVGWGAAWHMQKLNITELELNHANERIAIQRAARAATERHIAQVSVAQSAAAHRADTIATELAGNRTELERLRDTSAASVRSAGQSLDACTAALAAHALVSTQCAARYAEVAADSDAWASHGIALQDAWPK